MREEADVVVPEDRTGGLEAEGEPAVLERFRQLAQGRTAIIISHRFPTVRMADRIIVIERGKIIEEGTDTDLLVRGGRYAKLFMVQAEGYRGRSKRRATAWRTKLVPRCPLALERGA